MAVIRILKGKEAHKAGRDIDKRIRKLKKIMREQGAKSFEGCYIDEDGQVRSIIDDDDIDRDASS